ncbi:Crp/Fnr family transcriptional regulator [uncultured Sphingomonas sp.]|uniref:Crp/Fnr family transcriptional regulator n=1 Tax=uncultured Sphingomonas sp. TaxID=158754 RepID=UPI0035CAA079
MVGNEDGNGLERHDPLRQLFLDGGEARTVLRGERLHLAGEPSAYVHLLVKGWVGRSRSTEAGDAAFTAVHIGGDIVGADGLVNERVDDDLFTLSGGVIRKLPADVVRDAVARDPAVAASLLRLLAAETGFLREALFAVGRLSSGERLATFLLQTFHRLVRAGLLSPDARRFPLPLTQTQLAAVTGVTAVHLNRVLHMLRNVGCVEVGGGFVRIDDMAALKRETHAGPVGPKARAALNGTAESR